MITLACSYAPDGQDHWTLRLLAEQMVKLEIVDSISYETVRRGVKKRPEALAKAAMVYYAGSECDVAGQMEQVLELYQQPYDAKHPVVCIDEQPKQLIDEVNPPVPVRPGQVTKSDYEYVRHGVCNVWMFVEPLAGWRQVTVTEWRTSDDWAQQIRRRVDALHYVEAERIMLVCDNLNTHRLWSLYEAFEPKEAIRIARRLTLVCKPETWQLVEHGGARVECINPAMFAPANGHYGM